MRRILIETYDDRTTGQKIPYIVSLPKKTGASLGLIVNLHSCHREPMSMEKCLEMGRVDMQRWAKVRGLCSHIIIHPTGFGNTLFEGKGEQDVFDCIADISNKYTILADDVSLIGFSMGGSAALNLGARRPDVFRAVVAISGYTDSELWRGPTRASPHESEKGQIQSREAVSHAGNLRFTNILVAHGEWDLGIGGGVSYEQHLSITARMCEEGVQHTNITYKKTSHAEFPTVRRREVVNWLLKQKKKGFPQEFVFTVSDLRHNTFYGIEVQSLEHPEQPARIVGETRRGMLIISTENVGGIRVQAEQPVIIDGKRAIEREVKCLRNFAAPGPLSDILWTHVSFCYDTRCEDELSRVLQEEMARAECRYLKSKNGGISCGAFREGSCFYDHQVLPYEKPPASPPGTTLVFYGTSEANSIVGEALDKLGIAIDEEGIRLGPNISLSGSLGIKMLTKADDGGYIVLNAGTNESIIAKGFGIWYGSLPDYVIYNNEKITHYGYLGNDWKLDESRFWKVKACTC